MGPDHLLMLGVDFADILVMDILANIDRRSVALDHFDEAGRYVAALAFGLEDHAAAVRRSRIGTEHAEEIWTARHGQAEKGGRIVVGPFLPEIAAVAPGDVEARRHLGDLEAGRDHDDIGAPQFAVRRYDAFGGKMIDRVGDKLNVRLRQRPEPIVVEQDPLAVRRIGRHAFFDQVGTILQFRDDEIGELLAMPVIAFVDGAIGIRPARILAQERQ